MPGSPCQDQAVKFLPSGYTLLKDAFNGRWRVDSRLFTCSRSCLKYGEVASFALVASECWKFETGGASPHDWINDLATKHG